MVRLAIGIPTRNRAELAMTAVESALRSAPPEVAVIVSDNSTDEGERRRLEEFCAGQPPGAVEYVRPPEPLRMPMHWEWLWGVIKERIAPTHVAYVTDRLVLVDGALAELVEVVDRHPGRVMSYQCDHVDDLTVPVELVQRPWTGQLLELDARRLIELSSRGRWGDFVPRMLNSVAPLGVMDAIERRFGDVFGDISPDYRFAYRCLAISEATLYLDRSCVIEHGMSQSSGGSFGRGKMNEGATHFARQLTGPRFGATPEPGFETVANAIFQEYCAVRAEGCDERFPAPEPRSYLAANAVSVERIGDPEWGERMQRLLSARGWTRGRSARGAFGTVLGMAGYLIRHPGALVRSVKRQLWDRPPGTPASYLLPRVGLNPHIRDDLRFESSGEAIAHANTHPRPRTRHTWEVHRLTRVGALIRSHPAPRGGWGTAGPGFRAEARWN
jgi:hypothetical protein